MAYTRKFCGQDWIDAIFDNRLTYEIRDYGDFYTGQYKYKRDIGRHTSAMMQFYR